MFLKKPPRAGDPDAAGGFPGRPRPLPRSTPFSSCLTFLRFLWAESGLFGSLSARAGSWEPRMGGSPFYTSSKGRFTLYNDWNPPRRMRVGAQLYQELRVLLPPAVSPISSSFRSPERGRQGLFASRLLSRGPGFVPTSTPTSGSPRTAALLGGPGGRLWQEAGSQAPAQQKQNPSGWMGTAGLPRTALPI